MAVPPVTLNVSATSPWGEKPRMVVELNIPSAPSRVALSDSNT